MLGTKQHPSWIENEIYSMMDDYIIGMETYEKGLVDAIIDFFCSQCPDIEWNLNCSEWPDCSGGVCYVSWIEEGHIHMIGFNYKC